MKLKCIATILLFLSVSFAHAADLRGKLTGINGAQINVDCEGFKNSTSISATGKFHVTDLPANKSCFFTVNAGAVMSVRIPFSSNKSVTVYNGSLKKFSNKILVIRN